MTRAPYSTVLPYALLLAVPAAVLAACGEPETQYQPSALFVGQTTSAAAVAVVLGASSSQATLYACDGTGASAWFHGTASGSAVTAASDDGARAEATVSGARVMGTVELAGQRVDFTADTASGVAGIYLVEQSA